MDDVGPRYSSLPSPDSQAMRELVAEDEYRGRSSWENPITDSHTLGNMTLRAASDYVRTFAEAFRAERPPLYAHLVVARSALESSVVSSWLNESGIAYLERIKRGMCERLYSANEVKKLRLTPDGGQNVTQIKAEAASFGWEARFAGGKPAVDQTKRPSVGDGITQLLVDNGEARLGRLLWNRLSAVTHVTWWGLQWPLELPAGQSDSGIVTVSAGTDSAKVALQAFCILKALRVAATERVMLMGWNDAEWQAACDQSEARERALLASAQSP